MRFWITLFFLGELTLSFSAKAQRTFPQAAPSDLRDRAYAFTNATIYRDYQTRLDSATLVIRKGKVEACGKGVSIPKDAVVVDCSERTIYPAFLDLYGSGYGLPPIRTEARNPFTAPLQPYSTKKGAYAWNESLKPEFNAADVFVNDDKAASEWRKMGFGALLTHQPDGISRGTGALVALSTEREHQTLLIPRATHHLSLRRGNTAQNYPTSLMGVIALLRQTYLDAEWYRTAGAAEERNLSLEAWNRVQDLPQVVEAGDKLEILRIARIGKEFNQKYIVKAAGDEYQLLDEVKNAGLIGIIVSLKFPEAPDIRTSFDAEDIPFADLLHWELAPTNPARVAAAGIPFALTAGDLPDKKQFWPNLRKAIEYGLSETDALKALTWQAAQFVRAQDQLGSLDPGKWANFFIANGNIFKKDAKILETWVQGQRFEISAEPEINLSGIYRLTVDTLSYVLTVKGKPEALEAQLMRADSSTIKAKLTLANGLVTLSFQPDTTSKAFFSLTGEVRGNRWLGRGTTPEGVWTHWHAERTGDAPAEPSRPEKLSEKPQLGSVIYPFEAFGRKERPTAQTYLIRNATVWTNEREGILRNTDVLIADGKIRRIGRNLPAQDDAIVIDATGKHLTAGIIDEHSHIAISRGVNEGTQESSAEVRIGDVIDHEDINIYRQLAGGVTSAHLLHGSANPIGGQTQLIKMRWGLPPEALKFEGWPGQIKFALGENVKQSNWAEVQRTRYPQTRMGVEQVYIDYFTRAQEYARQKYSGKPYRKDLEMEALVEILESKRFITCHSYVQSEILMLMRVAERFGFRINTFTHILEGYKVAKEMRQHGVGASSFSDWWAYKFEVYQAIPYNPALLHQQGVLVAINSDDAEMARRLNQEAAKAVLYGGVSEEEAWKMVTLNPAKMLRVDDRVGSIKVGKDADVVLWSGHPLSVYTRAEKTWVDGIKYFDIEEDLRLREEMRRERARLLAKVQAERKADTEGSRRPNNFRPRQERHYHCDTLDDEGN
ncbi:MAG: amidohydrolase family protein [Saprospiraceae bacterium]|nr:amidohydrolase family protein [Saprospiraceae bacterium]MDW8483015.1 amidohydrolase family protein [Saprospiraceae bacterium]